MGRKPRSIEGPIDITGLEGKWVLEVRGKIVASSDRADVIFKRARKYPTEDAVVTKVLYPGASFY